MSFAALPAIAAVATIGGTIYNAYSAQHMASYQAAYQMRQAEAQARLMKRQAEAEAQSREARANIIDLNLGLVGSQQDQIRAQAGQQVRNLERMTDEVLGRQLTAFAANNISLESGSVGAVQEGTRRISAEEKQAIMANAERSIYDLSIQRSSMKYQAALERNAAENLRKTGVAGAATTLALGQNQAALTRLGGQQQMIGSLIGGGGTIASKWNSWFGS